MKQLSLDRMKWLLLILMFGLQALAMACSSSQQAQTKVQRQPLEKQHREYKTPTNYEQREVGYDPKTGKLITYDHKPRVELLDEQAGKYALKWIGYDGKEKTMIFQRADAIDVIVSASASKTSDGHYLYSYQAQNLPSSGTHLSGFVIQNFASDVKRVTVGGYSGQVSNDIYQFREGNWIGFGKSFFGMIFEPGQQMRIEIASSAPPGLVECRVYGGESTLQGAGEDMPMVLENLLPGYKAWPFGYTIGPVDNLRSLSLEEKAKYVLEKLPTFRKAGWMTDEAFSRYERSLKSNYLKAIFGQIDEDLKAEQITTEVFAILEALK